MKLLLMGFVLIAVSFSQKVTAQSLEGNSHPNIIFVLVDDMGWKDVGFMGSQYYETPHLDAFASQSMLFTNAYAGAANCAPSRACLMSGMYAPRTGIYTVGSSARGHAKTRKLIPVKNTKFLRDGILTLAEVFQQNGYVTANIGKWHIGKDPKTQGFTVNVAGGKNGHPSSYFSPYHLPALTDGPKDEYLTDRLTTEAIHFINKNKDRPFFLYLPYYAVHKPLQAPKSLVEKYKNKAPVDGQRNAVYAAMIENLDSNFYRILQTVDSLHLDKNTIIVFTSDNGGIRAVSHQDPLRAGKGSYYEGGIRVPLLVHWKGKIKPGSRSDVPVINLDFYPTLLALCGIKITGNKILDGIDISKLLFDPNTKIPQRPLFWHFPVYLQKYAGKEDESRDPLFRTRPGTAMRLGKWKLIEYFEDGALELYNLQKDLGEKNNVAKKYPEKLKELHKIMIQWRRSVHAPVPTKKNPEYVPGFVPQKQK
jgi:arylsulfatase A-like enzyme